MTSTIYESNIPYRVKCDTPECERLVTHVFRTVRQEGNSTYPITCCSREHNLLCQQRWDEKKKLDIRVGIPQKETIEDEYEGDNISDF